ncbi:MAG: ABC transporter permease [Chthoniobacterales bacterium]|nr:ABC transporter permease [Chthoniobacterales bacterium]
MKSFSAALVRQERRSGTFRRIFALCRKETLQIWRDPSSILIAVVLPIVMLFIFGFGINLDSSQLRVGLVIEDEGVEVQRFIASFVGSPYLRVSVGSRRQMEQALVDGDVRGLVVIASDFTAKLQRPNEFAPVQIITDGSEPNTAKFMENYAQGAWHVWLRERAAARGEPMPPSIQIDSRFWFNPAALSRNYIIPGSITIIMTVLGALLTSLVVAREWERGTMEALLATSITRGEFLLSKLLPYYVLGMVSELICIAVAVWILRVPFRGSIFMTLLVTSFFLFSALGLGLLLSTATRNQFDAAQGALNAAFLPSLMLSGFIYEISSMPLPIRLVTYLIPARYFVNAMQTLFQAGYVPQLLWRDLGCLVASSIFFLGLTAKLTKRRLD